MAESQGGRVNGRRVRGHISGNKRPQEKEGKKDRSWNNRVRQLKTKACEGHYLQCAKSKAANKQLFSLLINLLIIFFMNPLVV